MASEKLLWVAFFDYARSCLQQIADAGVATAKQAAATSEIEPVAHAVLLRAKCTSDAIKILIENGLLQDAAALSRGLVESEIFLRACEKDRKLTLEELERDWHYGREGHAKLVTEAMRAKPNDRQFAAQIVHENRGCARLDWKALSKRAGDVDPYILFRRISSIEGHLTAGSLQPHYQYDLNGNWSGFFTRPFSANEAEELFFECSRELIKIGQAYVALLGISDEVFDWASVVANFSAGVLPSEALGAKA